MKSPCRKRRCTEQKPLNLYRATRDHVNPVPNREAHTPTHSEHDGLTPLTHCTLSKEIHGAPTTGPKALPEDTAWTEASSPTDSSAPTSAGRKPTYCTDRLRGTTSRPLRPPLGQRRFILPASPLPPPHPRSSSSGVGNYTQKGTRPSVLGQRQRGTEAEGCPDQDRSTQSRIPRSEDGPKREIPRSPVRKDRCHPPTTALWKKMLTPQMRDLQPLALGKANTAIPNPRAVFLDRGFHVLLNPDGPSINERHRST